MSSINFPDLDQTLNSLRRLFDLFQEEFFYKIELKYKRYKQRKVKFHRYTTSEFNEAYVLESIDKDLLTYCMTGFRTGIKIGDFIVTDKINHTMYQVVNIDYYFDPSDMWIALLQECNH